MTAIDFRYSKIGYVALNVSDVDRSEAFYGPDNIRTSRFRLPSYMAILAVRTRGSVCGLEPMVLKCYTILASGRGGDIIT